ncbi:MAG: winged helix-turn-helix domain-containing protein [Armatimonadota bacterium]
MDDHRAISQAAAVLADPTRLEILLVLMDGRSYPATDLAARVHVSNSTASHHLGLLVEAGFVQVICQGRHRYHRLAGHEVADVVESLGAVAKPPQKVVTPLSAGRSCYNHLAGEIGVQVRQSLESRGFIGSASGIYEVLPIGKDLFESLGLDVGLTGKVCLDWTERVPHVGGALGRALFSALIEKGWICRGDVPRQIQLVQKDCFNAAFPHSL